MAETQAAVADETMEQVRIDATIRVGGRRFVVTPKTTQRQDLYIMSRLESAGFEKLRGQVGDDGDMSELAIKLLNAAYEQDTLFEVVGAILTEVDPAGEPVVLYDEKGKRQRWTKAKAVEIADLIANLDEEEEKAQTRGVMTSILILFFTTGAASSMDSPSSSSAAAAPASSATPRPDSSSPRSASDLLAEHLGAGGVDPTISGSGTASSASSPATTPTGSTP